MHTCQNKQSNKIEVTHPITPTTCKRPLKISSYFGSKMKIAVAIQNYLGNFSPPPKIYLIGYKS